MNAVASEAAEARYARGIPPIEDVVIIECGRNPGATGLDVLPSAWNAGIGGVNCASSESTGRDVVKGTSSAP